MVSSTTTSLQISEIKTSSSSTYSSFEKSISYIERTVQYFKDRTESFDDYYYFPYTKKKKKRCKLYHVINWLSMFADIHNKPIQNEMMMFLS